MLNFLSEKRVLVGSLALMIIMSSIVMLYVDPAIGGGAGISVIQLQLSFDKSVGQQIVNSWGLAGVANFNKLIVADYIYAFSYALFFASLLSWLILKKGVEKIGAFKFAVYFSFFAGFLDWVENTIELLFVNYPDAVSQGLFFVHSIVSTVKWSAIPIAIIYVVLLLNKEDVSLSSAGEAREGYM